MSHGAPSDALLQALVVELDPQALIEREQLLVRDLLPGQRQVDLNRRRALPEPAPVPPPPERDSGSMAWLTVTRGGSGLFRLQRDVFLVGGAPGCELRLPGLLTPGRLALLVRGRSGWSLLNVTRRGDGVQRNGQAVRLRSWLEDGDRLELGEVTARFRISVGVQT